MVGVPGAGKTTTAKALAEYFEVPYVHSGGIARARCPGDWYVKGDMAPEPCTTLAVEQVIDDMPEWILDGFPRSAFQLRGKRREAIVYLDVSTREARRRAFDRGKNPDEIEMYRIQEQTRILAPVKAQSAVVIPTTFRSPEQVIQAVIRWYEDDVHPSELGSNAR